MGLIVMLGRTDDFIEAFTADSESSLSLRRATVCIWVTVKYLCLNHLHLSGCILACMQVFLLSKTSCSRAALLLLHPWVIEGCKSRV